MFKNRIRLLGALVAISGLSACAPVLGLIGYGGSAIQLAAEIDRVKLLTDGVSFVSSGKTITDHAVSYIAGADCRLLHVVTPQPVCVPLRNESAERLHARVNLAAVSDNSTAGDVVAWDADETAAGIQDVSSAQENIAADQ